MAAARGRGRKDRSQALLQLLRDAEAEEDVYTTLTLLKTVCSRHEAQGKAAAARDSYRDGAVALLQKGHEESGYELCREFLRLCLTQEWPLSGSAEAAVESISNAFPVSTRKLDFLDRAIAWSIKFPAPAATPVEKATGAAKLHAWAAGACRSLGLPKRALQHFPFANSPQAFAVALHLWASAGEAGEGDLWLARGVLTCLNKGSLAAANALFQAWLGVVDKGAAGAPSDPTLATLTPMRPLQGAEGDTPLVHFLGFLLLSLQRAAGPLVCELALRYQHSLHRDPELPGVLAGAVGKWLGHAAGQAVAATLKDGKVPPLPAATAAGAPALALSRQASAASVPDDDLD